MSLDPSHEYIRPVDRIYQVATDKNTIDWKGFLHELINREGLDPWDIDLVVLTKTYIKALKEVQEVDFDISGKLLTIAVFLLKTKAEVLVERDLRGIEEQIESVQHSEDDSFESDLESLEALDDSFSELETKKKQEYKLKVRNPLARKRKVNIFDLIKTLEKTFEQSNKRKQNFLLKNTDVKYEGPRYEKKPKDLKQIIEELYSIIVDEFKEKQGKVGFSHINKKASDKMEVLERFIPLLHLHNQNKVKVIQEKHFGEIHIHEINEEKEHGN